MFNFKSVVLFFSVAFCFQNFYNVRCCFSCMLVYLLLCLPSIFVCTEKLLFNAYLSSWLPLTVCWTIKICHKPFYLLSNCSATHTQSIICMTQNFRSNGFVNITEMPGIQSMHKNLLSMILSCCLICKISCRCHELKIYTSVIPW